MDAPAGSTSGTPFLALELFLKVGSQLKTSVKTEFHEGRHEVFFPSGSSAWAWHGGGMIFVGFNYLENETPTEDARHPLDGWELC